MPTRRITPILILALAVGTSRLVAAPVITTATNTPAAGTATTSTTDETIYNSFVSTTDLLHGITGSGGTWNANGSSPAGLNDGNGAGDSNVSVPIGLTGAAWAANATASFREFFIGNGANGLGFNITEVQSIAAWQGASFQNQRYEILVSTVGSTAFTLLATVNFQPASGTSGSVQGGATKVNVTDSTGILATGIDAIRFNILDASGATAGGTVFREIDVFGVPTSPAADTTPPTLNTLTSVTPADGATNVPVANDLTATFSEPIALTGAGTITLRNQSGGADISITLPGDVSITGAVLTINPASNLASGTQYAVEIGTGTIRDIAAIPNAYAGLLATDTPNWNFTTGQPDPTAPALTSLSPADGATGVPLAANLTATFDEAVALGTGTISVRDLDTPANNVTITLPDGRVTISGPVLTINLASNLSPTTDYAVRISSGAIADLSGNPFGGIPDNTTWNFVTAPAPLRIMCIGDSITTGYTDNPSWTNHPFKFGYRGPLYTRLSNAGYNFLFVGGSTEPWTGISGDPTSGGTYTPALDLRTFRQDGHRGYGGKTASYLNSNILAWLASDDPDIILLKIGTNSQDQSGLNTLISTITTNNPDSHVIVAEIMPKYSYQAGIASYNTYIRDTLVPGFQAQGKKVTRVDQYAPFLTNPAVLTSIDQSLFSNGINHPDNDGYDKMAQVWFSGIEALGIGPNSFGTWISNPDFGIAPGQRGLDDDADRDGIDNGLENYFGTHPGEFSRGLVAGLKNGNTFTFTHPIGAATASDLNATYRWSKDLSTFTPSAVALQGTTVTFTPGTPAGGFVTVTATVTGTSLAKLFVDVEVTRR
jgi:hypothetical protein